ncbi:hypothetical protein [Streptomyces sp. TRM68367]|uniref:hypothetical protein n=1 Tax=Streptomyces sp. TRM68367 TaxID=2758415 RepID=UPI00165C76CF|nr:hypothetical protein [Streptomyces sp. TRM68367]MBC9729375.1 hypothetical protein [Streptomyces sp. TRM68367]
MRLIVYVEPERFQGNVGGSVCEPAAGGLPCTVDEFVGVGEIGKGNRQRTQRRHHQWPGRTAVGDEAGDQQLPLDQRQGLQGW